MSRPQTKLASLRTALGGLGESSRNALTDRDGTYTWHELVSDNPWRGLGHDLLGRSVVIATTSQLAAVAALVELDGAARRIVLYPPDLSLDHLAYVAQASAADALVTDRIDTHEGLACFCPEQWTRTPQQPETTCNTEWVLLTSGTTGRPKLVLHTLASLAGAIAPGPASAGTVWSTFYDIRRYGGLQIFLRAVLTGSSLVLSSAEEGTATFLVRAGATGVSHISGTPSHWRRALMSSAIDSIRPEYVRLSGEVADQGILNQLRAVFPQARIGHAFATTEAGVVFAVNDERMGFAADVIASTPGVELQVIDRSLRVRSSRTARCYLGPDAPSLRDSEGFVDTGDLVELREGRYYFAGRRDGMINVGGSKVYPEEVEAVINGHPRVRMSLVRTRKNPVTGALVVADVVLDSPGTSEEDKSLHVEILRLCRETLASHKVPAAINFVPELAVADSGKLVRRGALSIGRYF